jgi:hypothetical protein
MLPLGRLSQCFAFARRICSLLPISSKKVRRFHFLQVLEGGLQTDDRGMLWVYRMQQFLNLRGRGLVALLSLISLFVNDVYRAGA